MKILDFPSKIMSLIALLTLISGVIWYFVDEEVGSKLSALVLTHPVVSTKDNRVVTVQQELDELRVFRAEIRVSMDRIKVEILDLERRVSAIEPGPEMVEWDNLRSRVDDPCPEGSYCTYFFRYRRTSLGAGCTATNVRRYMVDSSGQFFVLRLAPEESPSTPQGLPEWIVTNRRFYLPEEARPGVAELFLVFDYVDCGDTAPEDQYLNEESPHLVFAVTR